jgi:hypothetical protein
MGRTQKGRKLLLECPQIVAEDVVAPADGVQYDRIDIRLQTLVLARQVNKFNSIETHPRLPGSQ